MKSSPLWPVVRFELTYHFRRISTYIYFAIWLVLGCLLVSMPEGQENAVLNNPFAIAQYTGAPMALGVIILSAICGMAVCRDFEDATYQVFFTTPLRRQDYLLGRLLGALLVSLFIFSGITLGLLLGTVMPWADKLHMAPIRLWVNVQPYLLFTATTVCWAGTLFFAIGALSRRIVFVYLQGVIFVAIYLGVQRMLGNLNDFWPALFDPFGFSAADQVAKYWTLSETNTRLIPLAGALLWNRVIWLGVGAAALIGVYRFFPFSTEALGRRQTKPQATEPEPLPETAPIRSSPITLRFDWRTTAATFMALTRLRARSIFTDLPFIAIAIFTVALNIVNGWGAPRIADTPVYPVTYLMTGNVGILMAIVITAMYAGELVWRERTLKFDQVYDALPLPGGLNFASQLAALIRVQIAILAAMMATGIIQQAAQGYFRFELNLYLKELFVLELSALVMYAVLAIFLQTILPNKFIGHAVVIGAFLGPGLLAELMDKWNVTIPANLYDFASAPEYTYSDMNRYGPYLTAILWYRIYWGAFAVALIAAAFMFGRRGTDSGWRARWRQACARAKVRVLAIAGTSLIAFLAAGSYIYYDARVVYTDSVVSG